MKTNQILTRPMGSFEVFQRTQDGMFNATELLKQWNIKNGMKKEIKDYFVNQSSKEFIDIIIEKENLNRGNSPYLKTRGKNGGTWMHPLLFIDFAMWINPAFKYDVLKFVYDQLIEYRNEAGNTYKEMAVQISRISKKSEIPTNISSIARALNHIVYGKHEKEMRNKQAEEESMKELLKLQIKVTELIREGFIKSYDDLVDYLRRIWRDKYMPKELTTI